MENNLQEIKTVLHFQAVFTTQSHIFKSYFIKSCKILEGLWGSPFCQSFFWKNNNHCSSCTSFFKKCTMFPTQFDFTSDRICH